MWGTHPDFSRNTTLPRHHLKGAIWQSARPRIKSLILWAHQSPTKADRQTHTHTEFDIQNEYKWVREGERKTLAMITMGCGSSTQGVTMCNPPKKYGEAGCLRVPNNWSFWSSLSTQVMTQTSKLKTEWESGKEKEGEATVQSYELTCGWSFRQLFLSAASLLRAMPDIVQQAELY